MADGAPPISANAPAPDRHQPSHRIRDLLITVVLTALALLLHDRIIILTDLENYLVDYRLRHCRPAPASPDLVYVSVDKTSYAGDFPNAVVQQAAGDDQYFMTLLRSEWPWTREIWAYVAERFMNTGAKGVLLDFIFPSEKPEDAELKAVLDRHAPRVVIGALVDPGEGSTSLIPPAATLIDPDQTGATINDSRVGLLNVRTSSDGVVRRGLYSLDLDSFFGLPETGSAKAPPLKTAVARAVAILNPGAEPPSGQLLRFAGPPGTFEPISLKRIIDAVEWKSQFADSDFFSGKFVLIGPGSAVLNDYHRTPFAEHGAEMSGPELLLNQINAALHNGFFTESTAGQNRMIIAGTGLLLLTILMLLRTGLTQMLATALLSAAFLFVTFWLSDRNDYMLTAVFSPLLVLNGGAFAALLLDRRRSFTPTAEARQ
jgi:CHASE2 domain-containing sensor protein